MAVKSLKFNESLIIIEDIIETVDNKSIRYNIRQNFLYLLIINTATI